MGIANWRKGVDEDSRSAVRNSHLLIVRACAVGDFILNLPALRALAGRHPGARFTLVGYPEKLECARLFISVETIESIETARWSRLFAGPQKFVAARGFDAAYVWMKDATYAENLRQSGVPKVLHASPFPVGDALVHAADHLLATLGLDSPEPPDFWAPSSERILVHPGSGSPTKCWPYFRDLIAGLPEATVLLGPLESSFQTTAPLLKGLGLLEAAEEIRRCRLFIGNDSGITHLAAYLGCPTIALFGPTDPRVWGPVGRRVEILWKSPLAGISVTEVRERLYEASQDIRYDARGV